MDVIIVVAAVVAGWTLLAVPTSVIVGRMIHYRG
jgi:hypothetical protein